MVAYAKEQQRRAALVDSVRYNRQALSLSTRLYNAGLTEFLNVLTAEQSLFVAENALAQSEGAVAIDLAALYKALGGGWENGTDSVAFAAIPRPATRPTIAAPVGISTTAPATDPPSPIPSTEPEILPATSSPAAPTTAPTTGPF